MTTSDDDRYRWSTGLRLTPDQYTRLGMLLPFADRLAELADAYDGGTELSAADGTEFDATGAEFTPDPGFEAARSFAAECVIQLAGEGYVSEAMDAADEAGLDMQEMAALQSALGSSYEREQVRQIEDDQDASELRLLGPRRTEERLGRALDRISRDTYTPPYVAPPAADDLGLASLCGIPDDFGRCASAYHQVWCDHNAANAAAVGSASEVQVWNAVLGRYASPQRRAQAGLAHPRPAQDTSYHALAQDLGLAGEGQDADARARQAALSLARRALAGFR